MIKDEMFEEILKLDTGAGTKNYLIVIYYLGGGVTVKNINDYLNKNLTYQNLEEALEEFIDNGVIEITTKIVSGIKRRAFSINIDKLCEAASE